MIRSSIRRKALLDIRKVIVAKFTIHVVNVKEISDSNISCVLNKIIS